ncbi:MAG: Cys-Gln thioester bond-forming surface protein [Clostridia bacterium]|nr:Cys-Gln thioester bond-forming surface protein [Clostridia bacterium]
MLKTIHRILAAAMVFCLCVTALPTMAFAAEDGLVTTIDTAADTAEDGDGNTVVTVTVEKRTQGTTPDGVTVDKRETITDIAKTDTAGNVLSTAHEEEGTEKREWEEDVKPGEETAEVKVELKPGEKTHGTAEQTTTEIVGEEPQSPEDTDYNFTEITTRAERSIEAETSGVNITVDKMDTELESVRADHYEGKDPNVFGPDLDFVADAADKIPQPEEEGYDYQLTGYGDATNELKVLRDYITYKKVDGKPVTDENGNYIIEKIETKLDNTPMQIALRKDENGEYVYFFGYCIDSDTETQDGAWYKVANLHDNDYYPDPDSAPMLRAVVANGYWGTESGMGSVEQIKALIKEKCGPDAVITVDTDDRGGKATYKIADIIDDLTESEALAATQAAIWSFANGDSSTRDGKDGYVAYGPVNVYKPNPNRNVYQREYLPESDARAMAVFNWLRSLAPIADTEDEVTTIINEKNYVGDMWLTVKEKAEGHDENTDADTDNDVYNTELNFTLAFVPDPNKDDLLVYLLDSEGNVMKNKDGEPMVRRLAGKDSEGRAADSIQPDRNGVYTLSGLQLSENSDFKFDLRLEGAQYLKEGVYIYTAHGGSDKSQSLVGIAEGIHTVDVSAGMTIRFEVDENKHVITGQTWHSRSDKVYEVPAASEGNTCNSAPIEEIYLAKPVKTGDVSFMLTGMAAISAIGLAYVCTINSRTKDN